MPIQDYYSVHGENAIYIAKTFYKTLAVVKYIGGSNGLPGELHLYELSLMYDAIELSVAEKADSDFDIVLVF